MTNTLSKDKLFYRFYPEPILEYSPAYSIKTTRYTTPNNTDTTTKKVTYNPTEVRQPRSNEIIIITGNKPQDSITIPGTTKQSSGVGAIAFTVIVTIPASYYWYIPEPYLREQNIIGWNGSAISKEYFTNTGETEFSIDATSIGVMVGLTTTNRAVIDSGYQLINYAFYGNLSKYTVYVNGSPVNVSGNFITTDVFKIILGKDSVRFLVNGVEKYSVSCTPELSTYRLDTSLYTSNDKVLNASIKQSSYINLGLSKDKQYVTINGVRYEVVNGKIFINGIWYSVITTGFVYIDGVLYIVQNGKIFINGIYVPVLNGTVTIDGVHGGSYVVDYSPIVIINNKVYSVTKDNLSNWFLVIGSSLISKDYSYIQSDVSVGSRIEPFYDLTNEAKVGSSLIYLGGSYIESKFEVGSSLSPKYGLFSEASVGSVLYYKGYSFIGSEVKVGSSLVAGGLTPSRPPILISGFEVGSSIRDYFIEDPSLFIIV